MTTLSLDADAVRASVTMREAIAAVRAAFVDLDRGLFEQPPRWALDDGGFLVMGASHRPTSSVMVKTLSLNFTRTPAITGTVTYTTLEYSDCLVADAASVTALRTGAVVGVATDLVARPDASRMVLIGAGVQGADQVRGVLAVRPLSSLVVVDADPRRAEALLERLGDELSGVDATTSEALHEALADADVVCCATTATQPLFSARELPARVHVNAIGAYRPTMREELPVDLLADATVYVDDRSAVLEESGEVIDSLSAGVIGEADLVELGAALRADQLRVSQRTVFKTVGVAVQDWAIADLLATKALHGATGSSADGLDGAVSRAPARPSRP